MGSLPPLIFLLMLQWLHLNIEFYTNIEMYEPLQVVSSEAKIVHGETAAPRMTYSPRVIAEFSSKSCATNSSQTLWESWYPPQAKTRRRNQGGLSAFPELSPTVQVWSKQPLLHTQQKPWKRWSHVFRRHQGNHPLYPEPRVSDTLFYGVQQSAVLSLTLSVSVWSCEDSM